MKKLMIIVLAGFLLTGCSGLMILKESNMDQKTIDRLYRDCKLDGRLDKFVFDKAMTGYGRIRSEKQNIITIVDFSQPSTDKRMYVIDLKKKELLFRTYAAHGVNTGETEAVNFSNKKGSRKSSLGFYLTAETYEGKHGLSLRLDGLEQGINHRARKRYIVVHSANYVSEQFIRENGRLGRSWGCPALPEEISDDIINTIKDGSVFFIYAKNDDYLSRSKILR